VRHVVPKTDLDFPVSAMIRTAPKPVGHVPAPDTSTPVKKGAYLANLGGCQDCHTPTLTGGQRFTVAPGVSVVSANISPDPTTGIGRWSEQFFVERIAQYREYVAQGSPKATPQSFTVMPWLNFAQLPDDDLRAIYAWIRTQPPVTKAVETHPEFDPAPVAQ
jgi:mono/diheme cytochrome c family protein